MMKIQTNQQRGKTPSYLSDLLASQEGGHSELASQEAAIRAKIAAQKTKLNMANLKQKAANMFNNGLDFIKHNPHAFIAGGVVVTGGIASKIAYDYYKKKDLEGLN